MRKLIVALSDIWRLAVPYFRSTASAEISFGRLGSLHLTERWIALSLLAVIVILNIAQVYLSVLLNQWNGRFFTALQERNGEAFWTELQTFTILAVFWIVRAVYELYLTQVLTIRWRRFATEYLTQRWLAQHAHYRMRMNGERADNPDQRIAEDVRLFVETTLGLAMRILVSVLSLQAFVIILWGLSANFSYSVRGFDLSAIPGYLVWAALIYAVFGTVVTHYIGRILIPVNFEKQRREADFRFSLARIRENGEQIALLGGEGREAAGLKTQFAEVIRNWLDYMRYTKRLTWFTAFHRQLSMIFPFVMLGPAYFSGAVQLGALTQTSDAMGEVQNALSLFVQIYREIAEYRAVVTRLTGFVEAVDEESRTDGQRISRATIAEPIVSAENLVVALPNGAPIVSAAALQVAGGERVILAGPSGSGKSTLFRALAGIWTHGSGTVRIGENARLMVLPQRPYVPHGSLLAAIAYPAEQPELETAAVEAALKAVGLEKFVGSLNEIAPWHQTLSVGEQQRLSIVRALLARPDFLLLDETTAAVDEATEASLYALLAKHLPQTGIITIAHRQSLFALHDRVMRLEPDGSGAFRLT